MLTFIKDIGMILPTEKSPRKYRYYLVRCECGKEFGIAKNNFDKKVKSCEQCRLKTPTNYRHGNANKTLYHTWNNMIYRCYNDDNKAFMRYGGRGIKVCTEWKNNFETFETWALGNGFTEGLTLERVNNNIGYSPLNCRFITKSAQTKNRCCSVINRFTEEELSDICEMYEELGLSYKSLGSMLNVNPKTVCNIIKGKYNA